MMKTLQLTILSILFLNISVPVYAAIDVTDMDNAKTKIHHLEDVLASAKKATNVMVEFPMVVPKSKKSYFSNLDTNSKQYGFSYIINVDATPDCHGVKYCNIGIVSAQKNGSVNKMSDRHNKIITESITLADGLPAYYTPGHAMGDYFPASIQWIDDNVLYMISWNIDASSAKDSKALLTMMANSAKHPGSG